MELVSKIRLVLAGMLLAMGFMITQGAFGNTDPNNKLKKEQSDNKTEYLKQAEYYKILAQLESEEITLEQAQIKWQKAITKIRKKEEAN